MNWHLTNVDSPSNISRNDQSMKNKLLAVFSSTTVNHAELEVLIELLMFLCKLDNRISTQNEQDIGLNSSTLEWQSTTTFHSFHWRMICKVDSVIAGPKDQYCTYLGGLLDELDSTESVQRALDIVRIMSELDGEVDPLGSACIDYAAS